VNAGDVLRRAAEQLGGRGGGTAAQAQGGAPLAPGEVVVEAMELALTRPDG
jgi:hypothetical protein